MKTISIPTNDRLDLLAQVIGSIQAAKGSEQWTLIFSCEPVQKVCDYVSRINWAPIYFSRNVCQMGCWVNTFLAANLAMSLGSDLNLYIEDDILISPDTLTMVDEFAKTRFPILALRRPEGTLSKDPVLVKGFQGGLFGDGFAWRKAQWPLVRSCWFQPDHTGNFVMWDWSVESQLKLKRVPQVRPCMNRSQNIGIVGTHQHGYDPNRHSPRYMGTPVQQFHFMP